LFERQAHSWNLPVIQDIDGENETIANVMVQGEEDLTLLMPPGTPRVRYELTIPDYLTPPVRAGDIIGRKSFYAGDIYIGTVDLVSANTAMPRVITVSQQPDGQSFLDTAAGAVRDVFPFFAILTFVTLMVLGALLIIVRRRRIMRRRRRMARLRYSRRSKNDRNVGA
jgi:hypothetical protein